MDSSDILKLQLTPTGAPWCKVDGANIKANTLQWTPTGAPWQAVSGGSTETIEYIYGNIKRVSKVNWGYIKRVTTVTGH